MSTSDVFISYSSKNRAHAEALAEALEARGLDVWSDREIPVGHRFDKVITEALVGARCVVVLWSGDSTQSRWVRDEAADAAQRSLLVPALIDGDEIPLGFRSIQTEDLRDWRPGEESAELDSFLDAVERFLGHGLRGEGLHTLKELPTAEPAPQPFFPERFFRHPIFRHPIFRGFAAALLILAALGILLSWLGPSNPSGPGGPTGPEPPPPERTSTPDPEASGPDPSSTAPPPQPPPDEESPSEAPPEPLPPPSPTRTPSPPPPSEPPVNRNLPITFSEEHDFGRKRSAEAHGQLSDGSPARVTGTFRLKSRNNLHGLKAFVLVELLDNAGNVHHQTKARTWVDGRLVVTGRCEHTVNFNEEVANSARLAVRSVRLRFVEEQ